MEKKIKELFANPDISRNKGGKTTLENGQMLCIDCNLRKGAL